MRTGSSDITKEIVEKAINLHESVIRTEQNNDKRKIQLIELFVRLGDVDVGSVEEMARSNGEQNFEVRLNHHLKALLLAEKLYESDKKDYERVRTLARVYQRIGTNYLNIGEQAEKFQQSEKTQKSFPKA